MAAEVNGAAGNLGGSPPPLRGMQSLEMQLPHRPVLIACTTCVVQSLFGHFPAASQAPMNDARCVMRCSPPRAAIPVRQLQNFVDAGPAAAEAQPSAEQQRAMQWQPAQRVPGWGSAASRPAAAAEADAAEESTREATDAWVITEHALRSWPQGAPLLLLATCHLPVEALPPAVARHFGSSVTQVCQSN